MDISNFDSGAKNFLRQVNHDAEERDDIRTDELEIDIDEESKVMDEIEKHESIASRYGPGGSGGGASSEFVQTMRPKYNTGPKGVIADYNEWREKVIAEDKQKAMGMIAELEKKGLSSKYEKKTVEEEDDDLDSDDDDFFMQWKRKEASNLLSKIPIFGSLREISVSEYISCVDNEHPLVNVVIHLYENEVHGCKFVNHSMDQLAPIHPRIKFICIVASNAQKDWQKDALPTLLVYKGGELQQKHIRVTDTLGSTFTISEFESFLFSKEIVVEKKFVPPT